MPTEPTPDNSPDHPTDHPGVIAPPPLIYFVPLLVGIAVDTLVDGTDMGLPVLLRWLVGVPAIIGGLAMIGLGIERFVRAGTNPEPWKPAKTVVADGIYRITRNPMYLGMALAYFGVALIMDCWFTLALLPLAIIVIDRGVIAREERYLEAKFGGAYTLYKRDTRRWI